MVVVMGMGVVGLLLNFSFCSFCSSFCFSLSCASPVVVQFFSEIVLYIVLILGIVFPVVEIVEIGR